MKLNYYILALLTSALMAQAAPPPTPVIITALPFTITAPGTYVLKNNLLFNSDPNGIAIQIETTVQGSVTLDLQGFTITGPNVASITPGEATAASVGVAIGGDTASRGITNQYPIAIKNGTLTGFMTDVRAGDDGGAGGIPIKPINALAAKNLTLNTVKLNGTRQGVGFRFLTVNSTIIDSCTFQDAVSSGIVEGPAGKNNHYTNCTFTPATPGFPSVSVISVALPTDNQPHVLKDYQLDPPK
jgi:hypothetical protein